VKPQIEIEPLLKPAEVCELLKITPDTLKYWYRSGKLPPDAWTVGGHRRWKPATVLNSKPLSPGDPIPPERTGGMTGFVVGVCGHRLAGSEWAAGFRNCVRCGESR
jgi:helix-turn-helix protein